MRETLTMSEKFRVFIRLTFPVIMTQFSQLAGTFIAIVLTGQYSTVDLAGISIGYNIWIAMFLGFSGILLGLAPIIAHLLGAKSTESIPHQICQGLYLATGIGAFLLVLGILFLAPILRFLNLEPAAYDVAIVYMIAIGFAAFPMMWSCVMRCLVDCHGYTHYSMMIMISSFVLGVVLNYMLILGNFGAPALGGLGAGIATAICLWYQLVCYVVIAVRAKAFRDYKVFSHFTKPNMHIIKEQVRLGVPIGLAIFAEMSIFSVAGLVMAHYGTEVIAAHQAAISFTNLFYCFPLSISIASTIAVGYEVGAKRYLDARQYTVIARVLAVVIALLICMYSFTHLREIAGYYTKDPGMVQLIMNFLSYAVFFTVIDAFGTPIQGILRAYKDVRSVSVIAIGCYWGLSVPFVFLYTVVLKHGPYGIWMALLSAVFGAAICYTYRLWVIQNRRFPKDNQVPSR